MSTLLIGDKILLECGYKVLDCVDILLYRHDQEIGEDRFLMIKRAAEKRNNENRNRDDMDDREDENIVYEYPKGGMLVHESPLQAAYRELDEETCPDGSERVEFRHYLGCQTADVRSRNNKNYDLLRVHGFLIELLTDGSSINPRKYKGEPFVGHSWMILKEAREAVWMKSYAWVFFDEYEKLKQRGAV
jgi:8-oxo-dGTP pyrophosphatase MutT (NUDIX family)